jgi:ribonuclease BN (tRNA processing enzyme)
MFAGKYPGIRRRQKHLSVFGARGVRDFYDGLINVYGRWIEPEEGMMDILELDNTAPDGLSLGPMKVDSLPMEHISSSIGYRITLENGTSVAYTGDTDYCDNVVKLAENVDLFICESSTPDEMKSRGHLTPSFAGRIATEANVGNLVLTHFYPECDRCDMEKECRKTYSGPLVLARDLMEIEI